MKRFLHAILTFGSSRAIPPLVIGFFFLLYIGLAFFTDETLIALMALTRKSLILGAILAFIPLHSLFCILMETIRFLKTCRQLNGKTTDDMSELFDEVVELAGSTTVPNLDDRLISMGYKTRCSGNSIAAWRGISTFPVRILFLAGTFCLFTGILISVTSRSSLRQMVVEGEPLPTPEGIGGIVERITLANANGSILARTLTMEVAPSGSGYGRKTFGIYPPSLYQGAFVYPRYIGLALHLRFIAPDMSTAYETHSSLNAYPPGKEDSVVIPGSPYRIVFNIPEPEIGSERYISYMTGNFILRFKLLKEKEVLFSETVPAGGEFVRDGYHLSLPGVKRLVVTDFINDYGVLLIWASALFFAAACTLWLPIRAFFPHREMLFRFDPDMTRAYSRAEGGARKHAGIFHEVLDMIAKKVEG
jgi:hypothetical protein